VIHQVNRIVYCFGEQLVQGQITTVTNTCLTPDVIKTLQIADDIVNTVRDARIKVCWCWQD
jgi:hypothetical protein